MRYMFGLVGILFCTFIVVSMWAQHTATVSKVNKQVRPQAEQISGRGQDGQSVLDTFQVDPQPKTGEVRSLLVTSVTPGGAMAQYGLQKGDSIVSIRDLDVATMGDAESA